LRQFQKSSKILETPHRDLVAERFRRLFIQQPRSNCRVNFIDADFSISLLNYFCNYLFIST